MNPARRRLLLILTLILAPTLRAVVPKLPGARPVVEAIEHPSLQAALDAVPRTGGMVRLPPGEFVITEPLIIRHEDFRLEGADDGHDLVYADGHLFVTAQTSNSLVVLKVSDELRRGIP